MTSAPPRTHIISRSLIAVAAAVFVCIASPALAVTLSEARRIPASGWNVRAVANERGLLIASSLESPTNQVNLDFVPFEGAPARYSVNAGSELLSVTPVGTNGREFLAVYTVQPARFLPKGILLDSAGVPTRTVPMPAIDPPEYFPNWEYSVVLATPEGFDVYTPHDKRVLRLSVYLDGTTSGIWQTVAIYGYEIGVFEILNLPDGNLLMSLAGYPDCRICTCEPFIVPVHVAVTSRDALVQPLDFSELPPLLSPDVEVGSDGRMWLLGSPDFSGRTEVRELLASPGAAMAQSEVIATDTDGPGDDYSFMFLTRLTGGFLLTEMGPDGFSARLRTGNGHEWERLPVSSSENRVLAAVAGPSGGVAFILHDYNRQETEVRFLSLGRTRGVSPGKRVRPSRPE